MSEPITLTIDGQSITVPVGTTILDAAAHLGIEIPVICYHPHLTGNGLCRVCSVDAGGRVQMAACVSECGNGMDVRMEVDELSEGLNAGDHAGNDIATVEHLPINLDGGLPSGAGQLAEQTPIVAAENPQPLGNRKDELAMGRRGTDGLGDGLGG